MVLDQMEDLAFMHEHNMRTSIPAISCVTTRIKEQALSRQVQAYVDYHLAYINFGSSIQFSSSDYHVQRQPPQPPLEFAAPEQISESEGSYDMFAADIYNLGKVLEHAFEKPFPYNTGLAS
ncbi:hypothetical protein C8J56DRAFT_1043458 [Mycena floridula]|nr:hypothetical protein C8J56DRAFT_1043458 [Mycena floridula]